MLLQHLLVLLLVVGAPLWDRYEIPRLKASTEPRKKIHYYGKIMAATWICAIASALFIGIVSVFAIHTTPGEIAWLDPGSRGRMFMQGLTIGVLIVIFVPAVLALRSEKIRVKAGKAAKRMSFLLPSSGEERRWWWLVCLTAGIGEEVIYRGFLLHYLHVAPFHWSWTLALAVSSVIFGIGHLYQGIAGGASTVVVGFLFGLMFLATGNLLLPIVVHAVMDLRILALLPEGFATPTE